MTCQLLCHNHIIGVESVYTMPASDLYKAGLQNTRECKKKIYLDIYISQAELQNQQAKLGKPEGGRGLYSY